MCGNILNLLQITNSVYQSFKKSIYWAGREPCATLECESQLREPLMRLNPTTIWWDVALTPSDNTSPHHISWGPAILRGNPTLPSSDLSHHLWWDNFHNLLMRPFPLTFWQGIMTQLPITLNTWNIRSIQQTQLHCTALECNVIQCTAMECNATQCDTMKYNVIQCIALHFTALYHTAIQWTWMQYNAIKCIASDRTAVPRACHPSLLVQEQLPVEGGDGCVGHGREGGRGNAPHLQSTVHHS